MRNVRIVPCQTARTADGHAPMPTRFRQAPIFALSPTHEKVIAERQEASPNCSFSRLLRSSSVCNQILTRAVIVNSVAYERLITNLLSIDNLASRLGRIAAQVGVRICVVIYLGRRVIPILFIG